MPSKLKKDDLIVDHSATALADSFLDQMRSSAGKEVHDSDSDGNEGQNPDETPRPNRLGLGAKFVSHAQALKANDPAANRLAEKLKGQQNKGQGRFATEQMRSKTGSDEDDEGESRTKVVKKVKLPTSTESAPQPENSIPGKKKRKRNKKGSEKEVSAQNPASKAGLDEEEKSGNDSNRQENVEKKGKKKSKVSDEQHPDPKAQLGPKKQNEQKEDTGLDGAQEAETEKPGPNKQKIQFEDPPEYVHKPRRKRVPGKKTRSRQKNIKKDNRPAHLKPGFQKPAAEE